jgi:hypothetical protein
LIVDEDRKEITISEEELDLSEVSGDDESSGKQDKSCIFDMEVEVYNTRKR